MQVVDTESRPPEHATLTAEQLELDRVAGPMWNCTSEYPSISSNEFVHDTEQSDRLVKLLIETTERIQPLMKAALTPGAAVPANELVFGLQEISDLHEQAFVLLHNLITFVHCELSIDGTNADAQKILGALSQKFAALEAAKAPQKLFLGQAPQAVIERYLAHPRTKSEEFSVRRARLLAETQLSEKEETLLSSMRTHGATAWGTLYQQISSKLVCKMEKPDGTVESVGLAQASGLLRSDKEPERKAAWLAIQAAWKEQETSCAAILNGLVGWRLQEYERRSHTRSVHFMDSPIFESAIKAETLEAMMSAVLEYRPVAQRAMKAKARGLNKKTLDPWDLFAPAPPKNQAGGKRTFKEALTLIHDAFASVDPSMGDFINMMARNRWIEGRVLPTKRQGAYCTGFAKSRTPRVYMTFMGSISDTLTLAHELGHAYHGWVMRDLPLVAQQYPMTLAETASIFAETLLADNMSEDPAVAREISWQEADSVTSFLLNISARFDFEKSLYQRRKESGFVSPAEMNELYEVAWRKWYGDTLTTVENQYWMTKMHFSFSDITFYNFPYTFGALFALSIYSRREEYGREFMEKYVALLRDTGTMTAEDLAMKHLGEDITKPEFWIKSLEMMNKQVTRFEGP